MARILLYISVLVCMRGTSGHWNRWHRYHQPCHPVNCCWSSWSRWTPCAGDCTEMRFRSILRQQMCGGRACVGASYETRKCTETCHVNNGQPGEHEGHHGHEHGVSQKTLIAVGSSAAAIILLLSLALMYALCCRTPGKSGKRSGKAVVPVEAEAPPAYAEKEVEKF